MPKVFSDIAFADYIEWQSSDKNTWQKINALIKSIERDGAMKGIGKPEKMKYEKGKYSRRIDHANRLVYQVSDDIITILSCKGHYED
ncbi:MAG: Txe/YoeB family addiction module toxin [Selenomonadaceae bacterium]|nr:Txe/YoeB family addiction module toxin [Selenomonadaceae bacterium]